MNFLFLFVFFLSFNLIYCFLFQIFYLQSDHEGYETSGVLGLAGPPGPQVLINLHRH